MPFVPNTVASIPIKPAAFAVAVPAAAKTVLTDVSNTAVLVPLNNNNIRTLGAIFIQPLANYASGRAMLFLYDGTSYFLVDEVALVAPGATGPNFPKIPFPTWTIANPFVIPEGFSLLVATSVAQTANNLVAHAQLAKVF